MTPEEWNANVVRVGELIKQFAEIEFPHVVALATNGQVLASGLLVRYRDQHFIFTAGHVIRDTEAPLRRGELILGSHLERGSIVLERSTETKHDYRRDAETYTDAGIFRLDRRTVDKINTWTLNRWRTLPNLDLPSHGQLDQPSRLFFAAGYPAEFSTVEGSPPQRTLLANYTVMIWHRHPTEKREGAFCFHAPKDEAIPIHEKGPTAVTSLSGLSGAPVWTADFRDGRWLLRLVAIHSASSREIAVAVPITQDADLLKTSGWVATASE